MSDAGTTPGTRDVYRGMTWLELLNDTLDQAGADIGDYTDEELARFRRWCVESFEHIAAEIPQEAGRRTMTLATAIGDSLYYLDYDVDELLSALDADGMPVLVLTREEYDSELRKNDGSWPSDSDTMMVLWELHEGTGRWIVRVVPTPTSASTIEIIYLPKTSNVEDFEQVIPLPTLFHKALRHQMRVELHTRQEDWKAKEDAMRDVELAIVKAVSRYRPNRQVRKAFRSMYSSRSSRSRQPGSYR